MPEVREPSYYFQDGQWHESVAHSGSVVGPVREPSPDETHDIVVSIPSRFLTAPGDPDVDLFDRIAEVAYAWEAEQGDRDGWDVTVMAVPSLEARLAAVEAELAEARATVARCQAVYDGVHRKDSTLLCSVRCTDLAAALAGPPAPKETT